MHRLYWPDSLLSQQSFGKCGSMRIFATKDKAAGESAPMLYEESISLFGPCN